MGLLINQLRLDPLSGRWVVVSPGRSERPHSSPTGSPGRPTPSDAPAPSAGNEEDMPPALETYAAAVAGRPGWYLTSTRPLEGDEPPLRPRDWGPVRTQARSRYRMRIPTSSPKGPRDVGHALSQEQWSL